MKPIIQKLWLAITMLCLSITASAYDFESGGIFYNITSMSNLEVEVSSNNAFNEIHLGNWCWENTTPYTGVVEIPSSVNYNNKTFSVVGIGKAAFGYPQQYYSGQINYFDASSYGRPTAVTSVILPSSIKYIDDMAFQGCKIESMELPVSLERIGVAAFAYTSLNSVMLPDGVQTVQKSAFLGSCLMSIVLGKNLSNVGDKTFNSCGKLMEVFCTSKSRPDGLTMQSFSGSHSALEVYVPSSEVYGFGRDYLTFPIDKYDYTGQSHVIEWSNNLKAYKCEITESDCQTDISAGNYSKYLTAKYSNGVDFSVDIPYEYTIDKASMTFTVNDVVREYGDSNPAFTCSITGFVNGENEQTLGATPSFECEANQMSKVGNYKILASLNAPNYEITYKYGTLSVIKAPLTTTVLDASRVYGNQNPEFQLSFVGLKNGETAPEWNVNPKFATSADVFSNIGQYEVSASGGVAVNYDITKKNPGNLTISKRDLTVKANDCERLYDEENPVFEVSYIGFVNGDTDKSLDSKPVAECMADKSSNAGTYPIVVTGGDALNYQFIYKDGTLTIKPLTVGFMDVYNSVSYNDMSISTCNLYFNYIPEIVGPYSEDDFWLELWFLDKDNKYDQHVTTISGGDYAGNYVNTNADRPMYAGKYIFNLTSKGTNPNVTANPSRAYLTVNRASNNLEWDADSPISVKVGEKIDLGISYQADLWCTFNTDYNQDLISLSSEGETGYNPHWYATGLKEGETTMYFSIECMKNDMGFYDFTDSRTLSKRIVVEPSAGIGDIVGEDTSVSIAIVEGNLRILNKDSKVIVRVFSTQGTLLCETKENEVSNLAAGLYIVAIGNQSFKVKI